MQTRRTQCSHVSNKKTKKKKKKKQSLNFNQNNSDKESSNSSVDIENSPDIKSKSLQNPNSSMKLITMISTSRPKSINVITKSKEFLLDIIDKIQDEDIKRQYLLKLKELILSEEKQKDVDSYNLKDILKRFDKPTQVTLSVLQEEINILKNQVKELQKLQKPPGRRS